MTKRVLLWLMTIALLMGSAVPVWAKPAPSPSPNAPVKAGNITALLPVVHLVRGSGKTGVTSDARKGDELVWNDLVKTEKGGRARVTLADQSILSLGSQAELRIVKHDPRAQQTAIQMAYGRVRAQVASITRDGGSFELRTPTAVAGVIGTDFGVDSSATDGDTFVCIAGATQISNADPNVPGSVQCSAGQTTTVQPGKSPTAPKPASLQQLQQLIEDTEPAIISSMVPAAAMPGTNFDSTISGAKLGKVTSVTVAGGSGVSASIKSTSDTAVQIHVVIAPAAPAGPRTLTFAKEAGSSSATVFMVLGTPIGDPKKAYLEVLEQLKTTGVGGLSAFLTGAQQAADQVAQEITQANQNLPKPLDLSPFADSLNQQYGVLSNDLKGGTGAIDKAAQDAATTFAGLYDTAYQSLLQRDPTGAPDGTFNTALTGAFTQANAILQAALQNTQTGLNGAVQTYGNQLNTIQQTWSQNINAAFLDQQAGPLPKVNALERIVEQGAVTSFDAASSSASNSSVSINSYQWTLCAPNYQPSGFGQMLPQGVAACNAIQGYISSSSEFQVATCSLQPGSYFARLAVTDSNNKMSQMDVKLTVLAPNYPTPGGTVRALADAYTSLQLSQFLRYFDGAQFNGYTPLSENIRQTMQSLSSMAINLRLSQENVTCNDATVRADWQQNYSFISAPKAIYSQEEQLSVRLQRTPGAGWFITDFQGDNGKVQGVPGPQTTDTAAPDLGITTTTIDGRSVSNLVPLQVGSGPHTIVVNVTNTGSSPLQGAGSLPVIITLQDTNGSNVTTVDTFNGTIPSPLASGGVSPITATLNFPATATNLTLLVQVNPSCNPPEKTCGAPNNSSYPLILGLPDFTATFAQTSAVNGIAGRPFRLSAVNVTPSPYPVALTVAYTGLPAGLAAASPVNNTTNINGDLIAGTPAAAGPPSTVTATASVAGGTAKNLTGSLTINIGNEIAIAEPATPTIASTGPAQNLTVNVTGGVYPVTLALTLPTGITTTSGTVTGNISKQTINGPGAITWSLSADFTATPGSLTANIVATDPGIPATSTPPANVVFAAKYNLSGNADYVITGFNAPGHTSPYTQASALQIGEGITFLVTVKNAGNTSPTGNVTVSLDCGNPAFCQTPLTGTVAAPTAGASVTIPIVADFSNFAVASYNGSATLTTNVAGAQLGGPLLLPFDVVDFTISSNINFTPQNILIGGSAGISVAVATLVPSGPSFPVTVTPTPAANLAFVPTAANGNGSNVPFTVVVSPSMPPTAPRTTDFISVSASNHGVVKTAKVPIPVNYFNVSLISTSLFVNDPASPLNVPVALGTLVPQTAPNLQMRVSGNYDTTSGTATLAFLQPGCGSFTANFSSISIVPNDTLSLLIYANQGVNCPPGTPVKIDASIPQTFPPQDVPVYTLYVNASALPSLSVVSATPSRDITNAPWLSGEALDWTVTVANNGSGASSGNDKVTFFLDNAQAGQTTLPSIPAGQQTTVSIHVVANDLAQDSPNLFGFIRIHVENDPKGSFDPSTYKDLSQSVNIANWRIQVTGGGQFDGDTNFSLSPTTTSLTTTVAISPVTGGFNPNIVLSLVPGVYSSGQLNAPGFSPNTLNSSGPSTVTVTPNATTPVNGNYFVQVIAQMKDGGTVTAQRQATIHVLMSGQSKTPAGVNLVSDRNNLAACPDGCFNPQSTVQLNGPLPEAFTLTGSITSCSAGNGCPGNADVTFTDSYLTVTTPPITTVPFTQAGAPFAVRVKAADNPDGSINTGPADVNVSVSAIQASFFGTARTPNPDPVGTLFVMKFNIGDLSVGVQGPCISVPPGATAAIAYFASLNALNGFNLPSVQWEWQDSNHVQVGGSPLSFGANSGSSNLSGTNYPLPQFNLINSGQGVDGIQTYYFAVTVSNAVATATEYFPVDFDLSTNQNFCPVLSASRGSTGRTIKGVWGKAGLLAPSSLSSARTAGGKLPDLRVSANDISFTPSVPKAGDKVEVRFRISNVGDGNAVGVPVALQVRGNTVAVDTFDVPAGKAVLGGLHWTKAQLSAGSVQSATQRGNLQARSAVRNAKLGIDAVQTDTTQAIGARGTGGAGRFALNAQIVIDPQKTITQKSTLAKSAALAHFDVRDTAADAATMASLGEQHALLILSEGACGGLKIASGAGSCTSADLNFTVEDLAQGTYKLEANEGVADLGIGNTSYANASFGMQALLQNGHTYAVQTRGGGVSLVTITAVRSPQQLSEAAKRLFRQGQAVTIVKSLGGSSDAPQTGDVAGKGSDALVYFDITYVGQ